MSDEKHPLPHGGGSYIRHPDGSLTLDEPPTMDAAVATERAVEAAVKRPLKSPVKEA